MRRDGTSIGRERKPPSKSRPVRHEKARPGIKTAKGPKPPAAAIHALQRLTDGYIQQLDDEAARFRPTVHQWSQREIDALILALSARRPLLVRGEPGTGKTQLGRAVAAWLKWRLHSLTIHPRIEASDLIYRFDAVKRFRDAQLGLRLDETRYWEPGPLWKAFGWKLACEYGGMRKHKKDPLPRGHVVLLDEIDKADSDVPNSLLDVLGQWTFEIPQLQLEFGSAQQQLPLILITTNEERELPAAFIRRCVVLNLEPDARLGYAEWLLQRGQAHFSEGQLELEVMQQAAARLAKDREEASQAGLPPPGLAEYIDLLTALDALAGGDKAQQLDWMRKLNSFAFIKHRKVEGFNDTDQRRDFHSGESQKGG